MDDLDRFLALETRRLSLISTRVEPFDAGTAYFDDAYPERFVSNLLVVDDAGGISGDELIGMADDILGRSGSLHRFVKVLDDGARHLAPTFRDAGYEPGRIVGMVLRRPPDRPAGLEVEECSFDAVLPLTEEIYRRELPSHPRPRPGSSNNTRRGIASSAHDASSLGSTEARPGSASCT